MPFVGGLSFNPTLLSRALGVGLVERADFARHLASLADAMPGTLFVQTLSYDTDGIIADAREIVSITGRERVVIKIPFSEEGLRATQRLEAIGVATCTTSIFNVLGAYVAATSGASWIAPYCNRITLRGGDGVAEIRAMAETFNQHALPCEILVASVKTTEELSAVLLAPARHVTVSVDLLERVAHHPASAEASAAFQSALRWAEHGKS